MGKKDFTGNWTRGHVCYALAESVSVFAHVLRPWETEIRDNALIDLMNEI